jgi:Pentapeptide repeats (9 copies)
MSTSPTTAPINWLAKLKAGETLKFPAPPKGREETREEKAARTISAKWLEELFATPATASRPVKIEHGIISGPLRLRHASFEADFCLVSCELTGRLDLSFATFKRLAIFKNCIFKQAADFRGARFHSDLKLYGSTFQRWARFQEIEVEHALDACCASFGQGIFARATIKKSAFFKAASFGKEGKRAAFTHGAVFLDANFTGTAEFQGSLFKNKANFNRMQVVGSALFRTENEAGRTTFRGEAVFLNAKVTGNAEFDGAMFEADVIFDGIDVGGNAYFRTDKGMHRTTFGGKVSFVHALLNKEAVFDGADFKSTATFKGMQASRARFLADAGGHGNRATFANNVDFRSATFRFEGQFFAAFKAETDFCETHFAGLADFKGSEFAANGAKFTGSHFERGACFDYAKFNGAADFSASVSDRDLTFIGTVFCAPICFMEARSKVVFFGNPCPAPASASLWQKLTRSNSTVDRSAKIDDSIDFRGFQYERIYVDLDLLFKRFQPFDRQPYSQLESSLRLIGEERAAHRGYLERRRQERKLKFGLFSMHHWILDWLYKLGANYGIRPYRLVLCGFILVGMGVVVFSQSRALVPKDKTQGIECSRRAMEASIHYFLPMDSPVGAECIPASEVVKVSVPIPFMTRRVILPARPDWCGTALRVLGTILMGIGVAASSGLLRRIAR